jgi:hypothetical protein
MTNMSAKLGECRTFLQWTRDCRAVDKRRQVCYQLDETIMLNPKIHWKYYITQDNSQRLDCSSLNSRFFSFTKLIWGIFIFVQIGIWVVREWTFGDEKALAIPWR